MSIDNSGNASITINPMLTPNKVQSYRHLHRLTPPIVAATGRTIRRNDRESPDLSQRAFDARWKPKEADTTYTATIDFDYSGAALCNLLPLSR